MGIEFLLSMQRQFKMQLVKHGLLCWPITYFGREDAAYYFLC